MSPPWGPITWVTESYACGQKAKPDVVVDVVVAMLLDRRTPTGDGSPQLEAAAAAATSSMENTIRAGFMGACSYSGHGGLRRRVFDGSLEQEVFRLGGFDQARCSVRSCERGPDTGASPQLNRATG